MPSKWYRKASRLAINSWQLAAEYPEDMLDRYRMSDPFADVVTMGSEKASSLIGNGHSAARTSEAMRAMRFMDFINFMSDDVLVKVDRASMASSLEVRSPILDHRVIEFAWSLPLDYCLQDHNGKRVLRNMLERYVPRSLFDRPKQGFALPSEWLRESMREWVGDHLNEDRLREHRCFDTQALALFWRQYRSGWKRRSHVMFHLAIFEGWRAAQQQSRPIDATHCLKG
jgi:asparagine synthase (glutamine-hydrolysing)